MGGDGHDRSALELRALQRVIASGARAFDLDVVLDRCLEQALQVAHTDAGVIYLSNEKRGVHDIALRHGVGPELTPDVMPFTPALRDHTHFLVDMRAAYGPDRQAQDLAVERGFTHALLLFLRVEERRIGFVSLLFRGAPTLGESTIHTLEAIAGFEAVAIEHARAHRQLELRARLAQLLSDCGERLLDPDADVPALVLETAARIARADRAFLTEVIEGPAGARSVRMTHATGAAVPFVGITIPADMPYVRESLAGSIPTAIEDTATLEPGSFIASFTKERGTRSFMVANMRQKDGSLGQIFVGSSEPRSYAVGEIEAMQLLGNLAAQALARARRQAQERAEHAQIAAVLEHLPIVVGVIDVNGDVVHINEAGRAFARRIDSDGSDWRLAMATLRIFDRDGQPVPMEKLAVMRAFGGEPVAEELTLLSQSDERFHVLAVTVPLKTEEGTVGAVLSSFQDVTQLRDLADAKDRFLSIASHELRSPITSLRATASLLQIEPAALQDEGRRLVLFSRIQRQVDRLSTLVERLLDTTRLNAGELPLDYAECDLSTLCHDAADHARLTDREHAYTVDAPQPIAGRWDPARIEQVLTNLISNAHRYSPHKSEIVVRARLDEERAIVDVVDQGVGIAPEQLEKLFTPFFRGAGATRHKGGLGLGLYISREIVQRHGGILRVASTPGLGSTFTVELPRRPKMG